MIKSKVIGIAGGMGPKSGLLLFDYIMKHTNSNRDQDHLPVILFSFPNQIQDRTAFLEGEIPLNPAYAIIKVIKRLEQAGAEVIGIPCNTSYCPQIFNVIQEEILASNLGAQVLHMPSEVVNYLSVNYSRYKKIGILSTNGTYHTQIYKLALERAGFIPVVPNVRFQHEVIHRLIYDPSFGLKANTENITETALEYIQQINTYFQEQQAEMLLFGCTELSMLHQVQMALPFIDSTEILAKALIRMATSEQLITV